MSLKKSAISGVKWTTISTITLAISAIVKISVLARFLDKADFGLMAIVVFVLGLMDLFMDMGLTSAILHKQNITKNEYSSLYWINFIFSILLYSFILLIAPALSKFYSEPELAKLFPIMGLVLILSAFGRQFKTIEQKNLNFKFIAIIEISSSTVSLISAIIWAANGYGVYALVYSAILKQLIANISFLVAGAFKKGLLFRFRYAETKPFLKIGIFQVGGQVINYFNRDLDVLLIGKFYGSEILGGYSLAKQLVFRPAMVINPILTRVAAPVLAKFQDDIKILRKNYLRLVNMISSINVPVYIGIIIFAPFLVNILYGPNFDDIVILVRILSVYMIFRSIGNPIGALVIATGRTDLDFYWSMFTLAIMPIAVIIGSQYSIEWVAIFITVAMMLLLIPNWWFLSRKMIKVSLSNYLYCIIPGVVVLKDFNARN